jgi:ribosomal protein S18 acetylase RimI-like enzyme
MPGEPTLDNPIWAALSGPHSAFARTLGQAARYEGGVAAFAAVASDTTEAWNDLRELAGDEPLALTGLIPASLPEGWELVRHLPCFQMVDTGSLNARLADLPGITSLDVDDANEMLDLVSRTEPGPFSRRTAELGSFFGIREDSNSKTLAAMAGERFAGGGWREISAVCTDQRYRGRGFASALIATVTRDIRDRGERAFLHVTKTNPALRLYESLGFEVRRDFGFVVVRPSETRPRRPVSIGSREPRDY